ncbi:MAG: DUF5674 family protein [bacterium]|nr:DUF5674 family protein [bacterium]
MKLIIKPISLTELKNISKNNFGNLVKAVVDIDKQVMVIDAEMHADEEKELLANGSTQFSLWGINLYPEFFNTDNFIEFDSMINLRPSQNNYSRGVGDVNIQKQIITIVSKLITEK